MPRRVMLATPAYDGRVEVGYTHALVQSIKLCASKGVELHPVWWPGEALVQHARNMLVQLALDAKVDDMVFVDADQEWEPAQMLSLLAHAVDVVGAPVRKKTDAAEEYNVRANSPNCRIDPRSGLWIVDAVGTGFLRVSHSALLAIWELSPPYQKGTQQCRMVFDLKVIDGQLWGEDTLFCARLTELGFPIHLDPSFTVAHIGAKKYTGDFAAWVKKLRRQAG